MQAIIATSSACMDSTPSQKVFIKHMHLHKASMKKMHSRKQLTEFIISSCSVCYYTDKFMVFEVLIFLAEVSTEIRTFKYKASTLTTEVAKEWLLYLTYMTHVVNS